MPLANATMLFDARLCHLLCNGKSNLGFMVSVRNYYFYTPFKG